MLTRAGTGRRTIATKSAYVFGNAVGELVEGKGRSCAGHLQGGRVEDLTMR